MLRYNLLTLFIFFLSSHSQGYVVMQDLQPAPFIHLNSFFSHYVVLVEKSTHTMFLYEKYHNTFRIIEEFSIATGQKKGDKLKENDQRTPEGIFWIEDFLSAEKLFKTSGKDAEMYGRGAFTLNFPNPMDKINKKTGSGIWIHATNNEKRIDLGLDSKGCVVIKNDHLVKLSQYLELHKTPILIVHELTYLSSAIMDEKKKDLLMFLQTWNEAWVKEDKKIYFEHYSRKYSTRSHGTFKRYRSYKTAVFRNSGQPQVKISEISLLETPQYATATFIQEYKSKTIKSTGKKTLYLVKDSYYKWKIIAEYWSQKGLSKKKLLPFFKREQVP